MHLCDDDRRGRAGALVLAAQRAEVDVQQLVAVEGKHVALLAPARRREPQAAAAAERLSLPHRLDLRTEARERVDEDVFLAGTARDDHARHSRSDEARDRVLRERIAGDGNERLRMSLRRVAESLRLAAREEERLHQCGSSAGRGGACGSGADA